MLRFILILLAFTTLIFACEQVEINDLANEVTNAEMKAKTATLDATYLKGQENESHRKGNPNVDAADLPTCILDYVSTNYPDAEIKKAQLKRDEYTLMLDNDVKLGFEVSDSGECTVLFVEEDDSDDDTEDDSDDDTEDDSDDDTDTDDSDDDTDTDDSDDDTDTDDSDDDTDTDDSDDDTDTDDSDDDTDTDDSDDDTDTDDDSDDDTEE